MAHGSSEDLTATERAALELVKGRSTDAKIARQLNVPAAEVEALITSVLAKAGFPSREALWLAEASKDLTARERDVLELLKLRWTNEEIAHHLVIEVRTVETHVSSVLHKLRYKDRRELWRHEIG